MFAIRDVDMSQHIMLLSHVAQLLLDKDVIDTLHHARTVEEIVNILRKEESGMKIVGITACPTGDRAHLHHEEENHRSGQSLRLSLPD